MNLTQAIALTHDLNGIHADTVAALATRYTGGNHATVIAAIARERRRRAEYVASMIGKPVVPFLTVERLREWRAQQLIAPPPTDGKYPARGR